MVGRRTLRFNTESGQDVTGADARYQGLSPAVGGCSQGSQFMIRARDYRFGRTHSWLAPRLAPLDDHRPACP